MIIFIPKHLQIAIDFKKMIDEKRINQTKQNLLSHVIAENMNLFFSHMHWLISQNIFIESLNVLHNVYFYASVKLNKES